MELGAAPRIDKSLIALPGRSPRPAHHDAANRAASKLVPAAVALARQRGGALGPQQVQAEERCPNRYHLAHDIPPSILPFPNDPCSASAPARLPASGTGSVCAQSYFEVSAHSCTACPVAGIVCLTVEAVASTCRPALMQGLKGHAVVLQGSRYPGVLSRKKRSL